VSPPHFSSNVVRWKSRRSSRAARSSIGLFVGSGRSGVVHVDTPANLPGREHVLPPRLPRELGGEGRGERGPEQEVVETEAGGDVTDDQHPRTVPAGE